MKGRRFFKYVALLVSLGAIMSACAAPATPQVQVIENTVEVQVTTVVEQEVVVDGFYGGTCFRRALPNRWPPILH